MGRKNVRQIAFSELLLFSLIICNCFGTSNSNESSSKNIIRKEVIDSDIEQKELDRVENKAKNNILSNNGNKIIDQKMDNTDPQKNQNNKTNPSKEKSKAKNKTTAKVTKAKNSKVNISKLQPNSHTTLSDAVTNGSKDNFGLPEPDEEYLRANEDIWKKYLADRKRKMNQQKDHDKK